MVKETDMNVCEPHRRRGRPVQMDSAAREEEIVRATKALLMSSSLDEVTMAAIARETGMSKRTIYAHFDSLEALLRRSMAEIGKVIFLPLNEVEKTKPLKERLSLLLTLNKPPVSEDRKREFLRTLIAIWNPDHPSERAVGSTVRALDESFHCDLVAAAGNREMTRIHREITDRLRIIRRLDFTRDDRVDATYVEHAQILEALRTGHAAEAADRLTMHIRTSQKAVREITMERIKEAAEAHKSGQKIARKEAIKQ